MANQYDTNLKLQAIADAIGDTSSSGLISALEDIADAVAGGGGGSSAGLVSDNFSETDTYDLGDYCIHNNTMYVCINAITTPGPWDLSDWQATNAGLELSSLNSALGNKFKVVWTLPSGTTSMNAGTNNLSDSLADFSYVGVKIDGIMHILQKNVRTMITASAYSGSLLVFYRVYNIHDTTFDVEKGYQNGVENNTRMIPQAIIGIW
jgi:hypothetical protein